MHEAPLAARDSKKQTAHETSFGAFRIDAIGLIPAFTISFFHCIACMAAGLSGSVRSPRAHSRVVTSHSVSASVVTVVT